MQKLHFSSRTMLVAVACVAVILAALARPTTATVSLLTLLLFVTNAAAVVGCIYRAGAVRAFCVGFAIFGWGQIVYEKLLSGDNLFYGPVQFLHTLYFGPFPFQSKTTPLNAPTPPGAAPILTPSQQLVFNAFQDRQSLFMAIGAAFGAIVLSLLGGLFAVYLYRTRDLSKPPHS